MKRSTSRISWLLAVLLLFQLFNFDLSFVKASGEASLPATYASSTATNGSGYVYDATNTLTTDIQINAASGKQILKITADMPDGRTGVDITPVGAIGQSSYRLQTALAGFGVDVISWNNDTAQGYTSWQQYTVGDPKGPYWFANLSDGSIAQCGLADGAPADSSYPSLPAYPGCNSTTFPVDLSFSGARDISYQLAPNIPSTIVDRSTLQGQVAINALADVPGPAGIPVGRPYANTTYNNRIDFGTTDNFTVHYNQNFNQPSNYSQPFALSGAKQMVYYAAFRVTITGKTYAYPKTINIIYQDAPAAPSTTPAPTATPTPTPTPVSTIGPEVINGDFHLEKTSMNFGQSNAAFPDNVSVTGGAGCSIAQFGYARRTYI